mmetsp:Transcript_19973/g.26961  ORF Transcript_19973/g.26961 Transcript_19973/m.26961 type:complete len:130 (-) Transcript_19973:1554-1943(-)
MRMPFKIVHEREVWRLFTSLYITHSFYTIAVNCAAQIVLGFVLEKLMGPCRFAFFYLLTGTSANALATACTDCYAAGPEPAIFGLLGGIIGMYVFHWEHLQLITVLRVGGCCLLVGLAAICLYLAVMVA